MNTVVETLEWNTPRARPIWLTVGAFVGVWLASAVVLGIQGAFAVEAPRWVLPVFGLFPILAYGLAYAGSQRFRALVHGVDVRILILMHAVRTVGLGFLFLYSYGLVAGAFAWPAAVGDLMAAIGALVLGIAMFKGVAVSRRRIYRWNLFGLLDFVVAVGIGTLLRSNLVGSMAVNTDIMGTMPLSLFPTFAVPFMVIVHIMIFQKLREPISY